MVQLQNFDPLERVSVQQGGLTFSRFTTDSLLPFVHHLLSQVHLTEAAGFTQLARVSQCRPVYGVIPLSGASLQELTATEFH